MNILQPIIKRTFETLGNPYLNKNFDYAQKISNDEKMECAGINIKLYDQCAQSDQNPNLSFICENDRTTICDSLGQQAGFTQKDTTKKVDVDWIPQDFEISSETNDYLKIVKLSEE